MNPVIQSVDNVFIFITAISVILLVGVTAVMLYFVVRYRASKNPVASNITGSTKLEVIWTVIPTILVLMMFYYGWEGFREMRTVSPDAYNIKVTGKMWMWSFKYPNGKTSDTVLYVPVGKHIKMELNSVDVVHSLYLPQFRIKEDAVPGRTNYLTFYPTQTGTFDIFCAEYCGMNHSYMLGKLKVIPESEFNTWVNNTESVKKDSTGTSPVPNTPSDTASRKDSTKIKDPKEDKKDTVNKK